MCSAANDLLLCFRYSPNTAILPICCVRALPDSYLLCKTNIARRHSIVFHGFSIPIQVHKKISIPLPGIFQRGRLYKAQSCSSIVRDKVIQSSSTNLNGNNTSNVRHSALITDKSRILSNCLGARLLGGSDGDINQPQQFNTESNSLRIPVTTATLNVTNANESQTNGSNALFGVSPSNTKTRPLCNNNYLLADCPCVPSNAIVLR